MEAGVEGGSLCGAVFVSCPISVAVGALMRSNLGFLAFKTEYVSQ